MIEPGAPQQIGKQAGQRQRAGALRDWHRFFSVEAGVLRRAPELLFQQAANQWDDGTVGRAARELAASGRELRPWLRLLNKRQDAGYCLATLAGHTAEVHSCAFSPDGKWIVSGSADTTIRLWDAETGRETAEVGRHPGLSECAFADGGRRIVSASREHVRLWDAATGALCAEIPRGEGYINGCTVSPDGTLIATWGGKSDSNPFFYREEDYLGELVLWDASTGAPAAIHARLREEVKCCAFAPDSRRIVAGCRTELLQWEEDVDKHTDDNGRLYLWDVDSGALERRFENPRYAKDQTFQRCSFSPDGARIIMSPDLFQWDTATGRLLGTTGVPGTVLNCVYTAGGEEILVHTDHTLNWLDSSNWSGSIKVRRSYRDEGFLRNIRVSPDESIVAASCIANLLLIDAAHATPRAILTGHHDDINDVRFSPDGRMIATASADATLRLWDAEAHEETTAPRGHREPISVVAVSPEGSRFVTGSQEGTLIIWSSRDATTIARHQSNSETPQLDSDCNQWCAWALDATLFVSCNENDSMRAFDGEDAADRGVCLTTHSPECPGFMPDGRAIIAWVNTNWMGERNWSLRRYAFGTAPDFGSWDRQYDEGIVTRGRELAQWPSGGPWPSCSAVSPEGRVVLSGVSDGQLIETTIEEPSTTRGVARHGDGILFCGFSPDGRLAFTVDSAHTLVIWKTDTWTQEGGLGGRDADVLGASFSPDGRSLATASADGHIRIWETATWSVRCTYPVQARVSALAWFPDGRRLIVGAGITPHLLILENMSVGATITTAWQHASRVKLIGSKRAGVPQVPCRACGSWFGVQVSALGGEVACPVCGRILALNPFVIDGDWRPVAKAWRQRQARA